jgi:hypothetical protein
MRLQLVLETFARGPKRGPARAPAREPFPFQELLPLKLKNSVSGKGEHSTGKYYQFVIIMKEKLKTSRVIFSRQNGNIRGDLPLKGKC